ncbi:endospore germination permease [Bacillus sp. es.036]|uniref:endospore germination permease n=1 Tax=Bacillus sp. es.036 TaxID=1761764 RepID=UPI000BF2E445|nr:endospore germination permease [Bacillus sp. es.036]PFG14437.1 spore germination protein (amino acid permease) [Bacillus sp. es.036]
MDFSRLQISILLILFLGISNHVILLPHLLEVAKRDAWVCAIIAYFILIIWVLALSFITNRMNHQKLYIWLKGRTSKYISEIISFSFLIYIVVIGVVSFSDLVNTVKIYFLPQTPMWAIIAPFIILCICAAYSSLKTLVYVSIILLPLVWGLGHFVAIATIHVKDYSLLFPIYTNGNGTLINGTIIVLAGNIDLLIILLLQHRINKSFSFLNLVVLMSLLVGLVIGPTMGAIASFGPHVAATFRFPAFEQWRLVALGDQISHLDFLAVFQLLSGAFIRVSLCIYLFFDILIRPTKKIKWGMIISYSTILIIFALLPGSDHWMQIVIGKYFYPGTLVFGLFVTITLFVISILPFKKGRATI